MAVHRQIRVSYTRFFVHKRILDTVISFNLSTNIRQSSGPRRFMCNFYV